MERKPVHKWVTKYCLLLEALLLVLFGMVIWQKERSVERAYGNHLLASVGYVYKENPESAKHMLSSLFYTTDSEEEIRCGEEALTTFGYTKEGSTFLNKTVIKKEGGLQMDFLLFLSAALLLYMTYMGRKVVKEEKELLAREIKTCLATGKEFVRGNDEIGRGKLEEEIGALISSYQGYQSYMKRKKAQMTNYVENIAHQIKTPISGISVALDLACEDAEEEQKEILMECQLQIDKINRLLKQLFSIGRLETGKVTFKKEPFRISELLASVVERLPVHTQVVTVKSEEKETKKEYQGDYGWLFEALYNILNNCLEHTAAEGRVEVGWKMDNESVQIAICDDGTGFTEEDLPYVFERFYLAANAKPAHTGIGLNLTRLVVEGHHGTIHARNCEMGGAGFYIMLPIYDMVSEKI